MNQSPNQQETPTKTSNSDVTTLPLREIIAHTAQLCHYITDANTTLSDIQILKDKARQVLNMINGEGR